MSEPTKTLSLSALRETLATSYDFVQDTIEGPYHTIHLSFFRTLIDSTTMQRDCLPILKRHSFSSLEDIRNLLPIEIMSITNNVNDIQNMILKGFVMIQLREEEETVLLVKISSDLYRPDAVANNESTIVGPQEAFVENIDTNIKLVRKRLPLSTVKTKGIIIGDLTKTSISIMYIEDIANPELVEEVQRRLEDIKFDIILDSSYIEQMLEDNKHSIFPLFMNTERPDRVVSSLASGKIAIFVDGSPSVIMTPTTFIDFFVATEDYNVSWIIGTALRFLRIVALIFSVFATPLYVAITTFHYELIPRNLLQTLISSRSTVPFPPFLEALFLEVTIELLREASTRLPVKIGQSLGVVGGIVVGQATVQAGLSSNVLIIFVALSALSGFTSPLYKVGFTIRFIRFMLLILAQGWGLLGIALGFMFVITHLLRLVSLGRAYMSLIPFRKQYIQDTAIRLPFFSQLKRTIQTKSPTPERDLVPPHITKRKTDFDELL